MLSIFVLPVSDSYYHIFTISSIRTAEISDIHVHCISGLTHTIISSWQIADKETMVYDVRPAASTPLPPPPPQHHHHHKFYKPTLSPKYVRNTPYN